MIEALQTCAQKGIYNQQFACDSLSSPEKIITLDQHPEPYTGHIHFYNHRRFHETLNYKKPMQVYEENIASNSQLQATA